MATQLSRVVFPTGDYIEDTTIDNTKLPLVGGTMTGQIVLASNGFKTSNTAGYTVDQYGNFKHQSSDTSQYWNIQNNAGTNKFSVYWETGNVTAAGTITASKFVGVSEADLQWGGKNFVGSYGCIDAALMDELGANRFQFIKASAITVEYSRDAGTTWTDYGATDAQKQQIFAQGGGLTIGKADSTHKATEHPGQYQLRITIDTGIASVYSYLNKFVIYVSTNGSGDCSCKIQKALQSTPTTFVDHTDWVAVTGWSGYNVINTSYLPTYGNSPSSQYGRVRFIFKDNTSTSTNYNGLAIIQIKAFGGVGWSTPSTMAKTGHLYSYKENQSAVFPNEVYATAFYENNVALSSKYFALSGGTITGVPKFGSGSISAFSGNIPYILGIEAFADGGAVKWKSSSDVTVGSATTASKLGSSNVGSATQPIYLNGGTATACTYTLGKSVPSDAVFTDTDTKVTQTETSTNADYELLFSSSTADGTTHTEGARKDDNLLYNPSSNTLGLRNTGISNSITPSSISISNSSGGGISIDNTNNKIEIGKSGTSITYSNTDVVTSNGNTWDGTNTSLKDAIANIIDLLHPVGSIYMSLTDSTVAEVEAKFGGTWEKIEDRFLLAASSSYAVNSTGGSANAVVVSHTHPLNGTNAKTSDQAAHTHPLNGTNAKAVDVGGHTHTEYAGINEATSGLFTSITGTRSYPNTHIIGGAGKTSSNGGHGHSLTGNTSTGGAHSHTLSGNTGAASDGESGTGKNMPPYLAVYMYKRTA